MGIHVCDWCELGTNRNQKYGPCSSHEVTLSFESGRTWTFRWEGLPHLVTMHNYCPPQVFMHDVMNSKVVEKSTAYSRSLSTPVGYLQYPQRIPIGPVPEGFIQQLAVLVENSKQCRDLTVWLARGG